jgi:hypothetical protein
MDRASQRRRRLPSHGTVIAYLALFLVLGGSGYAATQLAGGVRVTCSAKRGRAHVTCTVVGKGARGPVGPRGLQGPQGQPGPAGTSAGPSVFTQEPAFTVDPNNNPNFLTAAGAPKPDSYFEEVYSVAEDSNAVTDAQNDLYMPLETPSKLGGTTIHLSSIQFCVNVSPNTNVNYHGQSSVSIDKATVYELNEPKPAGGSGTGTASGPPAYSARVPLLQQTYTGQTQIDDCLTASAATPQAINPDGYLVLAVTVGLTTTGTQNNTFGTNLVQFGRVTTTYTP